MTNWIKCSDRLPKNDKLVLITDGNEVIMGRYCFKCNISEADYKEFTLTDCAWWMPLPEVPND